MTPVIILALVPDTDIGFKSSTDTESKYDNNDDNSLSARLSTQKTKGSWPLQ